MRGFTSLGWRITVLAVAKWWSFILIAAIAVGSPAATPVEQPAKPTGPRKLREDVPDAVRTIWTQREKSRADRSKALTLQQREMMLELGKIRRGVIGNNVPGAGNGTIIFRSREEKEAAIAAATAAADQMQAELTALKTMGLVPPTLSDSEEIKVGAIGYVRATKVLQVFNSKSAAIDLRGIKGSSAGKLQLGVRKDVCMVGFDTSELTDGQKYEKTLAIYVTGTRTFPTKDGGTRTIFVAEPFEGEDYLVSQ